MLPQDTRKNVIIVPATRRGMRRQKFVSNRDEFRQCSEISDDLVFRSVSCYIESSQNAAHDRERERSMSILTSASSASAWRGYEYYRENRVTGAVQTGEDIYEGEVSGTAPAPYHVKINTAHVRQSKCGCPHADGTRRICKHMVALYFTIFPQEAEQYIREVEEYEREEEQRWEAQDRALRAYIKGLSKKELQEELYRALIELEQQRYY